jgi:hypothetical protein
MAGGGHDEQAGLRADLDILEELLRTAEEDGNRKLAEAIRRVGRKRNDRLLEVNTLTATSASSMRGTAPRGHEGDTP